MAQSDPNQGEAAGLFMHRFPSVEDCWEGALMACREADRGTGCQRRSSGKEVQTLAIEVQPGFPLQAYELLLQMG